MNWRCMKIQLVMLLLSNFWLTVNAQPLLLTDENLNQVIETDAPELARIEASWAEALVTNSKTNELLSPELYTEGRYEKNKARTLIDFQPIYSPIKSAELGIRKKFQYGFSGSVGIGVDQRTGKSPAFNQTDATTTVGIVQLQLDLWKDLFGKTTSSQINSVYFAKQRAEIQKQIQKNSYQIAIRKIYWALVANKLSTRITQELLDQAIKQAEEAKRRKQSYIADDGEVSRYLAQVSSRQSLIYRLGYAKENLLKQLRILAPKLSEIEITIPDVDVESTIKEVLACTNKIAKDENTPLQYTSYDEVLNLLKEEKKLKLAANERYSDLDVQLLASAKTTGVDRGTPQKGTYSNSIDDLQDHDRTGYSVGLKMALPLDSTKSNTESAQEIYARKKYESEILALEANLKNSHEQLRKNIILIEKVIHEQDESSKHLKKRLSVMKLKFAQARVSVVELINDQDALLSSELDLIDSKLAILNLLFDYFNLFSETPCSFNRKY